jgi:hypothetical protein
VTDSAPDVDVNAHLRAGAALYTAGRFHAAHDPWEHAWLAVRDAAPDDAALLQGLIQTTAALHHARAGNREGATGLAESAADYLAAVPDGHRDVALDPIRTFLPDLDASLDAAATPPPLRIASREWTLVDLELPAAGPAGVALAEDEGFDESAVERAVAFAWADLEDSPTSPFADAILAFVAGSGAPRAVAYDRLRRRVEERQAREDDVSGLFDTE